MKILITGAAGFIGGHLFQKLNELGHEVVGIDNFFHPSNNPINNKVKKRDIRYALDDLVSWADIVYHLAAQIHVDYSIEHPAETFDVNVNSTIRILEACRSHKKKFVFASSSEIYGSSRSEYMDENHPLLPQSPYAISKLTGDQICQNYKDIYGMKVNVIRNFNTFGDYQNDTSYGAVIAIFVRNALSGNSLRIYGSGEQKRDYMHVTDALQGYLMSLETDLPGPVNFGTGKTVKINDLAEMIVRITGSKSPIVHVEPRPLEVQRLCAGIEKAKGLGFSPVTDLEKDIRNYVEHYRSTNGL